MSPDLAGDIADRTLVCEVEFPRQHGNRARPLRVCLSIAKLNQGGISDCEACPQKKTLDAALKTHGARLTGGEQDGIEVDLTWETVVGCLEEHLHRTDTRFPGEIPRRRDGSLADAFVTNQAAVASAAAQRSVAALRAFAWGFEVERAPVLLLLYPWPAEFIEVVC